MSLVRIRHDIAHQLAIRSPPIFVTCSVGSLMPNSECRTWLDREDEGCREGRLARLDWLADLMPPCEYLTFPGGWMAKSLFEEARYCFAYGQFLAAVVLGLSYIEHTLAGLLYAGGRSDLERASITVLLREAIELGWLTEEEYKNLEHARALRNPIAHFRRPLSEDTIESRSLVQNEQSYEVLEADARHVMTAAFHLLARQAIRS
jgi:hypothetical protein